MDIHFATATPLLAQHRHSQSCHNRIEMFMVEFLSVYDMALQGYKNHRPLLQKEMRTAKRARSNCAKNPPNWRRSVTSWTNWSPSARRNCFSKPKTWQTLRQLRQTNREQAEFTYEWRFQNPPRNTITMLINELEMSISPQMDEDGLELVNLIRKTSARMGRLVEDVLAYSRCLDQEIPPGRGSI